MLELCRLFGGSIVSISWIPQIYHTYKRKQVDDISYMWQTIYISGLGLSLIYEIYNKLWMMYLPTIFETLCIICLTIMKYYYETTPLPQEMEIINRV